MKDITHMQSGIKYITDFPPSEGFRYSEELWHRQHGNSIVLINCKASNIYYPEHWTPLSIKCAFNGKEFYKLKNTTYAVSDHNFLILNEGTEYSSYILSETVTESFTLNFTQGNLDHLSAVANSTDRLLLDDPFILRNCSTTFLQKLYPYSPRITSLILKLRIYSHSHHADSFRVHELLYALLTELFELNKLSGNEAQAINAKKSSTREELYKRLNIAKDYIGSCYHADLSLDELAKACHLNPYYLLREFKKFYHVTPHQYLISIRLQEAKKLVAATDKTIIQIIRETGWQDAASFSKLFKKHFGLSPAAFRNKHNP